MRALFLAVIVLFTASQISANDLVIQGATQANDPGILAKGAIGEVKAIDSAAKQITLKTDAGSVVLVTFSDKTSYKRLAPGETSLTSATDITLAEVAEGDRIWARGNVSEDRKSVPATMIVLMTKGDIAKKQEAERLEWRRRGILGVITAIKPDAHEIVIANRTVSGTQSVVLPVGDKTEMRRYAPDSIKFSDARPSTFSDLKVGDQLRALGDRGEDPLRFTPQKIVTGSFRTVGGVVTAVNAETGEIKINELEKKQPLTIVIKQDAVLRKFPSEMGMMGGGFNRGAGGPGGAPPASGQNAPAAGQGRPQGGPSGPRPGFNINDMLERLPTISIADVKVGDTIIVSSTQGVDPSRLTAISLVSGADHLLAMLAPRPQPGQATPNPAAGLGGSGISFGIGLP
ncbi:MAG TPA: hypothetical protein VFH91_00655 [Pyrinomonadaceae bacterium]|nr:hypothetical protein [Pyrinomonadaceae bacterium]